jgi:hypothetical protein
VALGVIVVSVQAAGYRQLAPVTSCWDVTFCQQHPLTYVVAEPWWQYAVVVVGGLLGLAFAVWLYRVAPRVVDRHVFIRRSTASSSL